MPYVRRLRQWLFLLALAATLPFVAVVLLKFGTDIRANRESAEQALLKEALSIASRCESERAAAASLLEQL
ncbi:MAG TPA: hypothetical protein VGQ76_27565, partial [Thermoanaerobaculia bacterium]|nr:hypothetical protein [Thermoanaerobaculia bacterium]